MELLASWKVAYGQEERMIQLLHGDLSNLPPEHAVDVLVVSAFRNDYLPTASSLIGALAGRGLSLSELAAKKKIDLREQFSCWLSQAVEGPFCFRHVVCLESGWHGTPPEICDDLFRALSPYLISEFPNASVAMPILGAGDQGWPVDAMMRAILHTTVSWLERGLPLRLLKIVAYSARDATIAEEIFLECQKQHNDWLQPGEKALSAAGGKEQGAERYECFLSYSHKDSAPAQLILNEILGRRPNTRVFFDHTSIKVGSSWLMKIADALDNSSRVVALYTPDYWSSRPCIDEFMAARTREYATGEQILFPIYFRKAHLPSLFQNLQFFDCREGDKAKLSEACRDLIRSIGS
jgi:hypothetical protein